MIFLSLLVTYFKNNKNKKKVVSSKQAGGLNATPSFIAQILAFTGLIAMWSLNKRKWRKIKNLISKFIERNLKTKSKMKRSLCKLKRSWMHTAALVFWIFLFLLLQECCRNIKKNSKNKNSAASTTVLVCATTVSFCILLFAKKN